MRSWASVAVLVMAGVALWSAGCEARHPENGATTGVAAGVGGAAVSVSSAGGGPTAGAGGQGGEAALPPPLRVGLEPNPLHVGPGEPTAVETMFAELTTYAAGVRAVTLRTHWEDLETEAGLDALASRVDAATQRGLEAALVVDVVDRRNAYRPARFASTTWDDPTLVAALDAALAATIDRVGDRIRVLVVGQDADVYRTTHPTEDVALAACLSEAIGHAIVLSPNGLGVAVGLSLRGGPLTEGTLALASLGSASAFRYAPGFGDGSVSNASEGAKDLDAMIAVAAGRPLFLTGVRFTSATSLGSTPAAQADRVASFFAALEPRRAHVRAVNFVRLHDLDPDACARRAAAEKLAVDDPEMRFDCASGLRDAGDEAKLSWQAFLKAASAYTPP